jgi:pilus assembly protein CpaF
MLQALNTGHDGSLTTVHANSATDALVRLETLALFAGAGLPLPAVRAQLASAIDAVIFVVRDATGARRVVEIGEVTRGTGEHPLAVRPLYAHVDGALAPLDSASRWRRPPEPPGDLAA